MYEQWQLFYAMGKVGKCPRRVGRTDSSSTVSWTCRSDKLDLNVDWRVETATSRTA